MTYRITIDTLQGQRSQEFRTKPAARSYVARAVGSAGFQSVSVSGPDGAGQWDADDVGEWLDNMRSNAREV